MKAEKEGESRFLMHMAVGSLSRGSEEDEEVLPAMADDDYSEQLSWQSQSKDNLKVLMDSFTPEQYERYEAYRRSALSKGAVRKVRAPSRIRYSSGSSLLSYYRSSNRAWDSK